MSRNEIPLIAHVVYRLDVGGMENGLVNLVNRLPENRFRHAIVSLTETTDFARRLERDDVELVSLHKRPGNDPRLYARLWKTFRRLAPAIVHTRNVATIEAVVPAKLSGVPFRIHGEHGRDVYDLDGTNARYRWLRRALAPWVHRFVALSGDLESYLVDRVGVARDKVSRIRNGVDLERFRPADGSRPALPAGAPFDASGCVVIGSVTRMQEVKDPVALARAFVRLLRDGLEPRARLVLLGDGPLLSRVGDVLEEADAGRYAWLAGERDDVPELLRSFDVYAQSSKVEGISNTVLEAMASGLPVVATRVGGNEELVDEGRTGALVPARDPEALAAALRGYVDDEQRRSAHGRAGRRRAEEEFGLERMVQRYRSLYEDVLRGRAARGPGPHPEPAPGEEERELQCVE